MDETPKKLDHSEFGDLIGFVDALADVTPETLRDVWRLAGQHGAFTFLLPDQMDSADGSAKAFVDAMLSFGEHCPDTGLAMAVISQIWTIQAPLIRFGTPEMRETYLQPLINGEMIGAFALTEANAGSDALALETRAVPTDGGYVLDGQKAFIGMGPVCDFAIVFAQSQPDKGRWGLSAFIVHAEDPGFGRHPAQKKLGLNSVPMGELSLDNCWVPETRRIGAEGAGATIIQTVLDWERCFILAAQVGAMRRQLGECVEHSLARSQFGKPISDFQSVSNRLADMRTRLETSELMLHRAAELYDTGQPLTQFAAMANLHISEAFLNSSVDAVRIFGGRGYLSGSNAGTDVTDALGGVIYSGTSDIQREIIAKLELGQRASTRHVEGQVG